MEQYTVTGMSCAACSTRVEKAVSKVPGVTSCSVSLLTNSMGVEGTASPEAIVKAVEDAGYGASKKGAEKAASASAADAEDALKDREVAGEQFLADHETGRGRRGEKPFYFGLFPEAVMVRAHGTTRGRLRSRADRIC